MLCYARQKFADALKTVTDKTNNSALASKEGLDYYNKLFTIERNLADLTPEARYKKRLELSKPVLEAFSSWLKLKGKQTLPKSTLGGAIDYCLNHWEKLEAFLLDGRLEISNNRTERAIKPYILGRKIGYLQTLLEELLRVQLFIALLKLKQQNSITLILFII